MNATGTTFTLPIAGEFLVSAIFITSATVQATFSPGSAITTVQCWADDASGGPVGAVSSGDAAIIAVYSVSSAGTGANNTITISGLTNLAGGSADIWVCQVPSSITTIVNVEEEKKEVNLLKTQVRDLGRMMRALLVRIPDNEEKDIDLVDLEDVRGPARPPKLERSMPIVGPESGILSSISRNSTPNKVNSGWFAGAK